MGAPSRLAVILTLPDPFGDRAALRLELAVGVVIVERRAHGVREADGYRGLALLERHADPGERAAGADGTDEAIDLAPGLFPDLGPRRLDVGLAVGHVVELVGPDRAVRLLLRELVGKPPRILHVVVGVAVGDRRHLDQLRAAEPQHVLLFLALGLRNHDHRAVAEGVAHQGETDTGVAGGALDDGPAGTEHAPPLGIAHDEERSPVLDRAAGVQELALAEDLAAGGLGGAVQSDQRRVADQFDETRYRCHGASHPRRKRRTLARISHRCHGLRRAQALVPLRRPADLVETFLQREPADAGERQAGEDRDAGGVAGVEKQHVVDRSDVSSPWLKATRGACKPRSLRHAAPRLPHSCDGSMNLPRRARTEVAFRVCELACTRHAAWEAGDARSG